MVDKLLGIIEKKDDIIRQQAENRKKHINPLVEQGRLKLTIPDKPNDPNQKYVKA